MEPQQSQLNDHDAAVETAVISQSEMVVTSPTTESAPVPEGYGTTPDHIILQPDKTGGLGDIGRYINSEMTTKEVEDTVIALSRGKKYELLTQHFSPPSHYKFPGTYENGCLRSFRYEYFKNRPWLKYSPHLDAAFCVPCALFVSNRSNKQSLVTKPFRKWTRYTSVIVEHAEKSYHRDAMIAAQTFRESIENPSTTLTCVFDKEKEKRIEENRQILKAIARAVLYCGRQCIALRGHREKLTQSENPGNFLALLKVLSESDPVLEAHLKTGGRVTYLSPQSQNEMIEVIGKHFIQKKIVEEILEAKYYSILGDEATSHNEEKLSIVIRFVDANKDIREEFLEFKDLERTTGAAVSETLLSTLRSLNIPIEDCRGQGYDGAASMSSQRVGVQANILTHAPNAAYVHCASHCLNLVVSHACSLQPIRNMIDKITQVCLFFNYSPKRNGLLTAVIQDQHPENGKKKPLITLCATRWVARIEAYDHFYASFKYTVFALEVIAHNMHHDECPEQFYGCWQTKTRTDASGLLKAITDFDFIVTFICAYSCLSHMSGLTVKLQKKTNDIFKAFSMVTEVKATYKRLRANLPTHFDEIYDQAVTMAEKVGVAPTAPRIAERQRHRANAPAVDPKEHYSVNVAVPFFDHIISELDDQFSSLTLRVSKLLGLVPSVIQESRVTAQQLTDLVDLYKDDLPSPQLFSSEFQRWKIMVQNGRIAADSCASSLKACDPDDFPNLYMLLKIAATLPVTTCECERSISTMRRLNNYMRCTMGESRLSSLALMHIKYDMPVNLEEIVNLFEGLHPRMMQFASLLYE